MPPSFDVTVTHAATTSEVTRSAASFLASAVYGLRLRDGFLQPFWLEYSVWLSACGDGYQVDRERAEGEGGQLFISRAPA